MLRLGPTASSWGPAESDDLLHRYAEALLGAGWLPRRDEDRDRALAALAAVRDEELEKLRAQVADYVGSVCWDTTCLRCAKLLDRCYEADMRREQAEAKPARMDALHQPRPARELLPCLDHARDPRRLEAVRRMLQRADHGVPPKAGRAAAQRRLATLFQLDGEDRIECPNRDCEASRGGPVVMTGAEYEQLGKMEAQAC